jgi:DNA helicase IV
MAHPDVPAEQAYLDRAYERLEVVRAETQARLEEAFRERGGTFQSYTERDIRVRSSLNRLEQLQLGREALIFGRIDRAAGPAGPATIGPATIGPGRTGPGTTRRPEEGHGGAEAFAGPDGAARPAAPSTGQREPSGLASESFHIGRLAVSDAQHEPLVVDWRAPVAEPFYRATGARPMGLRRRRHFLTDGRRVLDLEDELFAPDGAEGSAEVLGLSGPGVLMAALQRAHTGRMRDIVATVQAEQDEIIRSPLRGALVVQGGPGTGKTAVALHRAAYLLYTHRFPLEAQGVLVVGPNPTFLRYIDQVLPSLGETGAELSTASGLYKGARPVATEPAAVARLKGDPRMARWIRRAIRQRERPLRRTAEIPYGRMVLTLTPQASADIVTAVKRRSGRHNAKRRIVERLLWEHFAGQLERRANGGGGRGRAGLAPEGAGTGDPAPEAFGPQGLGPQGLGPEAFGPQGLGPEGLGPEGLGPEGPWPERLGKAQVTAAGLGAELRRRPEVAELLERIWPRFTAETFLHDLYGSRPLLGLAGNGVLSAAEIELLYRPRSEAIGEIPWSPADIALLDEASWLLGPVRSRLSSEPSSEQRLYGHIVVDEVQDLSPMELRMVGRRSLSGSMTLVGDIAQATGNWAPGSWDDLMAHLPARRGWRLASLSVSYRAPAEVMRLAAYVLAAALPGTVPPEPVRQTGHAPRVLTPLGDDSHDGMQQWATQPWHALVAATVEQELKAVSAIEGGEDGSVGVLVLTELLADVRSALVEGGVGFGQVGAGALDLPVSLLALGDAKGLEFDAVVVVEPARIVARPPEGLRALYVAVTRCTRRLAIVHREPLPAPLQAAISAEGNAGSSPASGSEGIGHPGNGAGEER